MHTRAYIMTFTWLGALRPLSGPRSWVLGRYLNAGIFTPVHDIHVTRGERRVLTDLKKKWYFFVSYKTLPQVCLHLNLVCLRIY